VEKTFLRILNLALSINVDNDDDNSDADNADDDVQNLVVNKS